ncbi:hypothetical protein ACJX0J_016456, partial [Zea mays]
AWDKKYQKFKYKLALIWQDIIKKKYFAQSEDNAKLLSGIGEQKNALTGMIFLVTLISVILCLWQAFLPDMYLSAWLALTLYNSILFFISWTPDKIYLMRLKQLMLWLVIVNDTIGTTANTSIYGVSGLVSTSKSPDDDFMWVAVCGVITNLV